jgi:hypothetical protein
MVYGVLADIVVVLHLLWILFLITGAYWGRKHPPVMIAHAGGLVFAVAMQVFGWYCPLTHLEVWLREKQGMGEAYPGSFIAYYAEKLIYLEVTGKMIFVLTILLVAGNIWIYTRAYRKAG